jgi:hypothetical protein
MQIRPTVGRKLTIYLMFLPLTLTYSEFFSRGLFFKFCSHVQNVEIMFQLYNMDARDLPEYLPHDRKVLDRIEVCLHVPTFT